MITYTILKNCMKGTALATLRVEVEGLENIPATGPALLVPNHQSILDPILVQGFCPRPVYTMTKSTQFASPFFRWLLPRVLAFPTRRYRIDPQTVRVALRHLDAGRLVGIYPEGERSWDGTLQPFRRGAVRVMLKAGVPVIPCGISGSYDVWPRWSRLPRVGHVRIRYGSPIHFGRHDRKEEREAVLEPTIRRLEQEIRQLMDEDVPRRQPRVQFA